MFKRTPTPIKEKMIRRLTNSNVEKVQVSLDGLEETHDRLRGLRGAFKHTVRAIRLLLDAGFRVSVATVVNKQNIDEVLDIVNYVLEIGVKDHKVGVFVPCGDGAARKDLTLTPHDTKRLSYMIDSKRKELRSLTRLRNNNGYPWLIQECSSQSPDLGSDNRDQTVRCAAGHSTLYITSEGKAAPCGIFRHLTFADLARTDPTWIWHESHLLETFRNIKRSDLKGQCGDCELLRNKRCWGGCRAAALAVTGDTFNSDPFCWKHLA